MMTEVQKRGAMMRNCASKTEVAPVPVARCRRLGPLSVIICTIAASGCGETELAPDNTLTHGVISELTLERATSDGVSRGLDLDGIASGDGDPRACRKGDFMSPTGEAGIDNEFARALALADAVGENAIETLIRGSISDGKLMVFLKLGRDEAGGYILDVERGMDIPLLDTDGLLLANQTLGLHTDRSLGSTSDITREGDVYKTGAFPLRMPIAVFASVYEVFFPEAFIEFRIDDDGRLVDGQIAGGIPIEDLLEMLRVASSRGNSFYEDFNGYVRDAGDLPYGGEECGAMSAAIGFDTVPVFNFE